MIDKNMIALAEIRNGYTLNKHGNLTLEQNSLIKYDNLCLNLIKENQELNKQLEEYKILGFKHLNDKCNNLETQQKEFIEYMNKTIEELECDDVDDEEMKDYLIQRIYTFKEIFSKYKEIIGGNDEN